MEVSNDFELCNFIRDTESRGSGYRKTQVCHDESITIKFHNDKAIKSITIKFHIVSIYVIQLLNRVVNFEKQYCGHLPKKSLPNDCKSSEITARSPLTTHKAIFDSAAS